MTPKRGKSQKNTGQLKYGAGRVWHNHYDSVDFIKGTGSLHGVKIVIPLKNAEKLSGDLKQCVKLAKQKNQKKVEIDAHFGMKMKEGFTLKVRIAQPTKEG